MPGIPRLVAAVLVVAAMDAGALTLIEPFSIEKDPEADRNGVFRFMELEEWGFVHRSGQVRIRARFAAAQDFFEGLAGVAVKRGEKLVWGFVRETGEMAIQPTFEAVRGFRQGRAAAKADGVWGYIDRTGAWVVRPRFVSAHDYHEGLVRVERPPEGVKRQFQYLDRSGQPVFGRTFKGAGDFREGLAWVALEGGVGYIDRSGQVRIAPRFAEAGNFREGLAAVREPGALWGYIGPDGRFRIAPMFWRALEFHEGVAVAQAPTEAPCISDDTLFNRLWNAKEWMRRAAGLPHLYNNCGPVRSGYINTRGQWLIEPRFLWARDLNQGLALVSTGWQDWLVRRTQAGLLRTEAWPSGGSAITHGAMWYPSGWLGADGKWFYVVAPERRSRPVI